MVAEERTNPISAKVCYSIFFVLRQHDRICEDHKVLVNTVLQITQNTLTVCDMIAVVTERLHHSGPCGRNISPSLKCANRGGRLG